MIESRGIDRRSMISRMGGAGLVSALVLAGPGTARIMASKSNVSNLTIYGTFAAGPWTGATYLANFALVIDDAEDIAEGTMTLADSSEDLAFVEIGVEYPVTGSIAGRAISLHTKLDDDHEMTFHGVVNDIADQTLEDAAGTFGGPIGCSMGTWSTLLVDDSAWCGVPDAPVWEPAQPESDVTGAATAETTQTSTGVVAESTPQSTPLATEPATCSTPTATESPADATPTPHEVEVTPEEPNVVPTQTVPSVTPTPTPTESVVDPTPTEPEPTPTAPEPTPTAPEPTPTAPEPTPTAPEPTPTAPEPTPTAPEPTPTAPEPTPTPSRTCTPRPPRP